MSGLRQLPGDEPPASRASKFIFAMSAIKEAVQAVEDLEVGLFGFQRHEIIEAKMSIRAAEERLIAVANLRGSGGPRAQDDAA